MTGKYQFLEKNWKINLNISLANIKIVFTMK